MSEDKQHPTDQHDEASTSDAEASSAEPSSAKSGSQAKPGPDAHDAPSEPVGNAWADEPDDEPQSESGSESGPESESVAESVAESAASVAGTRKLVSQGTIRPGDHVVAILTGHILKDPDSILDHQERFGISLETVEADIDAVTRLLDG